MQFANIPEVVVHRFEEKLVAWPIENVLEVPEGDIFWSFRYLHKIRRFFVVNVVNYFCFVRHNFFCTLKALGENPWWGSANARRSLAAGHVVAIRQYTYSSWTRKVDIRFYEIFFDSFSFCFFEYNLGDCINFRVKRYQVFGYGSPSGGQREVVWKEIYERAEKENAIVLKPFKRHAFCSNTIVILKCVIYW